MFLKIWSSSKWVVENWGKILGFSMSIATVVGFITGWFMAVNAAAEGYPTHEKRITKTEQRQEKFETRFDTFMEMYKLQVLGRNQEAQELARNFPSNKP